MIPVLLSWHNYIIIDRLTYLLLFISLLLDPVFSKFLKILLLALVVAGLSLKKTIYFLLVAIAQ